MVITRCQTGMSKVSNKNKRSLATQVQLDFGLEQHPEQHRPATDRPQCEQCGDPVYCLPEAPRSDLCETCYWLDLDSMVHKILAKPKKKKKRARKKPKVKELV